MEQFDLFFVLMYCSLVTLDIRVYVKERNVVKNRNPDSTETIIVSVERQSLTISLTINQSLNQSIIDCQ